jgi:hypothetical protein
VLFHKASEDKEARILALVGVALALCMAVALVVALANPFAGRDGEKLGIVIESPYLGEGVEAGTAVVMYGVQVGEVTEVVHLPGGGGRVAAELQRGPTAGLTTAMGIDFRPANYFGVTGINVRPADGGQRLVNGSTISITPAGNFTLQALLSRLGEISNGVVTPHLVDVITKSTTYLDGLSPLLETVLVVSESLANVQTVSTARLLTNATGISVAFPGFVDSSVNLANGTRRMFDDVSPEENDAVVNTTIDYAVSAIFGAAGHLLGSNSTNLNPLTDMIKVLTDAVPGLVPAQDVSATATELRLRLERLFSGSPDRRAVNVRVILDNLPGVAAPLAAEGVTP